MDVRVTIGVTDSGTTPFLKSNRDIVGISDRTAVDLLLLF
jgi:hypothetical protein